MKDENVVDVVQSVERQIVGLVVAGSSPVIHPSAALRQLTFRSVFRMVLPTVGDDRNLRP